MNISTSECSSGCESGWTTYLDHQISDSTDPYSNYSKPGEKGGAIYNEDHQEDEDLSMVSDASSGPPLHFRGEYENCTVEKKNNKKKINTKETKAKREHNYCLDDTASSSIFHFSQDNVPPSEDVPGFSKVFSDAHNFEGESKAKKHLGFFKSSTKGKSGNLLGRKKQ